MSKQQAEGVIKNIIREICEQCSAQGQAISETLVAFVVKAIVLNSDNGFSTDRTLTKDDVNRLIHLCVERLCDVNSPALQTIKMQVFFDMNYTSRSEFLAEHRQVLSQRLQPVVREILDSRPRSKDEFDVLYRKIVTAHLLRSGLGSPTDIAVVREATAALQSVFPQSELGNFLSLNKRDKERQIQELSMIVTGIRLFNKECGKGGEGIDDLAAILNEAIPATTESLDASLKKSLNAAYSFTAIIEKLYCETMDEGSLIELVKDALTNSRQHQQFLTSLLNDLLNCAERVEHLEGQLASRMETLQATIQQKTAVPTAQVYPQFVQLSQIWSGFQDEMVLLSVLSNLISGLEPYTAAHRTLISDQAIVALAQDVTAKTDKERRGENGGAENRVDAPRHRVGHEWLYGDSTKNFDKVPLQYRSFCPWALANFDRLLVPAIPEIGVLHYRAQYYAFCSNKAALEFAEDPGMYIDKILDIARGHPELIQLLDIHKQFSQVALGKSQGNGTSLVDKPVTKADMGCQTEVHPVESNIVRNYEWNEWELRRKAIRLANLRRKVTHGMNTNLSHQRRDNVSQVYLPKDQTTNTTVDNWSNVPKPSVFVSGLRGCGVDPQGQGLPTNMVKMDLTRPVKTEEHDWSNT